MVRPPAPHRYSAPHSFRCLELSLSPATPTRGRTYRGEAFPSSALEPEPSSRHLRAGHHQASKQAPARLIPGQQLDPGFDVVATFRQSAVVHSRSPSRFTLDTSRAPFLRRSPPRSFTAAARSSLRPPPAGRSRRAKPPSPAQHRNHSVRSSTSQPPVAFLAHDHQHTGHRVRADPGSERDLHCRVRHLGKRDGFVERPLRESTKIFAGTTAEAPELSVGVARMSG